MWIFKGFLTFSVDLFYIVLAKLLSAAIINSTQRIVTPQELLLFSRDGCSMSGIVFPVLPICPCSAPPFCLLWLPLVLLGLLFPFFPASTA